MFQVAGTMIHQLKSLKTDVKLKTIAILIVNKFRKMRCSNWQKIKDVPQKDTP